jgi:hypothetical protein
MAPRKPRRAKGANSRSTKRTYAAARMGRPRGLEWNVVLRVWRRLLERRLRARLGAPVEVDLHDNTHTMVTFQRVGGRFSVRLHHMFLKAQEPVLDALAGFIRGTDPDSSAELDRYIEQNRSLIRRPSPAKLRRRLELLPRGKHHDLSSILEALNRRYFRSRIRVNIAYSLAPRARRPRKSIKMGSYSADSKVIRIHPALDQPRVPRFFVEWIVFHEMLHHVHRARRAPDGRRCVHTPEFLAHERRFHDFSRAQAWEDRNLDLLLRA